MSGTFEDRSALVGRQRLAAFMSKAGYAKKGGIPEWMTFRQWCEDLAAKGMRIDQKPFSLADRPALIPLYDAIPTTRAEAFGQMIVVQKATQLGLTVWEVLADLYMAKKWGPLNIGMFLPETTTASFKSQHRFMPIVRSVPELYRELTHRVEGGAETRIGEGNVLTREFARSLIMFLWTSGKVSTESRPMDVISLDEVQGMPLDHIDKVMARLGNSLVQFKLMLSTANIADLDINRWYGFGTQEVWHTRCEACGAESDLSDPAGVFPDRSIGYNTGEWPGAPHNEYVWTCPACRAWIKDPQQGRYIAQNPAAGGRIRSFLLPRTISPRITPRDMFEGWHRAKTGDQKKSFYNRTLARPYIDADQMPVTMAICMACVTEGKRIGLVWERAGRETVMGIDQMGGWCAVIIKRRLPDGRQAVVHVEAVFGEDPFARCTELMKVYGVSACVVEQLPNVNDARRFANLPAHRGRVFLANYSGDFRADMIVWGDDATRSDRKTAEEDRSRYTVTLQQYKAMQNALLRIKDRFCLFPDPADLVQDVIDDGVTRRIPVLSEWAFVHFTKTALVVEQDENTRQPKPKVVKIGLDPHYSYALMLCDVAWSRNWGNGSFIMPETPKVAPIAERVAEALPGVNPALPKMMAEMPQGTCGRCVSFDAGRCTARDLATGAHEPGCMLYVGTEREA